MEAYVLIKTDPGTLGEVVRQIAAIGGVKSVRAVTGPYDAVALVEAADINALGRMAISQIQKVPGVARTITSLVVEV